jgi:hypothetical protein
MSTENTNNADHASNEENVVLTTTTATTAETASNDENIVLTTTAEPDPVPVFIPYDFSTNVDSNDFLLSGVLGK